MIIWSLAAGRRPLSAASVSAPRAGPLPGPAGRAERIGKSLPDSPSSHNDFNYAPQVRVLAAVARAVASSDPDWASRLFKDARKVTQSIQIYSGENEWTLNKGRTESAVFRALDEVGQAEAAAAYAMAEAASSDPKRAERLFAAAVTTARSASGGSDVMADIVEIMVRSAR